VILDLTPPMKMIGFVIPNQPTKQRLHSFVLSVDDIEVWTGYDFFSSLPEPLQSQLEKHSDFNAWGNTPAATPVQFD